jgi:ribosomal protein S18 acetylase RimI-like enzyme
LFKDNLILMALEFKTLKNKDLPELSFVRELYEKAFPSTERRDWEALSFLLDNPDMKLDLISQEAKPIGFIIWWGIGEWLFIEHLAMSPHSRGGGHGSAVMQYYLVKTKGKILLEVELPLTDDARRRISFYERLGLVLIPTTYRQPSYRETGVDYPMLLMASVINFVENDMETVITQMKNKVYKCK